MNASLSYGRGQLRVKHIAQSGGHIQVTLGMFPSLKGFTEPEGFLQQSAEWPDSKILHDSGFNWLISSKSPSFQDVIQTHAFGSQSRSPDHLACCYCTMWCHIFFEGRDHCLVALFTQVSQDGDLCSQIPHWTIPVARRPIKGFEETESRLLFLPCFDSSDYTAVYWHFTPPKSAAWTWLFGDFFAYAEAWTLVWVGWWVLG